MLATKHSYPHTIPGTAAAPLGATRWLGRSAALACMALSACAQFVDSKVTTYQQWPADAVGSTFAFRPSADQEKSLEYKTYENQVQLALQNTAKLRPVAAGQTPRFLVNLNYGITTETQHVVRANPVFYANFGSFWSDRHHGGWPWRHGFGAGWASGPWGWDNDFYDSVPVTVHTRNLVLGITEAKSENKVFEGKAISTGNSGELNQIMPYLVRSPFLDFPNANGQTRHVRFDSKTGVASVAPLPLQ